MPVSNDWSLPAPFMPYPAIRKAFKQRPMNHRIQEISTVLSDGETSLSSNRFHSASPLGVTKCFGEALCRYMAEKEGVPSIAVRIGAFQPLSEAKKKESLYMMDGWLSERDGVQLLERCIDAPESLKFAIVHGLSRNTFNRMDIESTRALLGYLPQDNFFEASEVFKDYSLTEKLDAHNVKYVQISKKVR